MNAKASKGNGYGIGAVAKLTGLTDHTIRVWERRYGAVVAKRAVNGRRIYEPADVDKLIILKRLTDQGMSIGQIADDTLDELRERAKRLDDFITTPIREQIRVAILGDFLPDQLAAQEHELTPVEVIVAENNRDRFVADISHRDIDVVVVESPVLDSEVCGRLVEFIERAGAARGVLVYSFGRVRDIESARDSRIVVLRAPVDVNETRAAILRAYSPVAPAPAAPTPAREVSEDNWDTAGPIEPRRFSNFQLMKLAKASTAIDCECPHHLAQLVGDLTAFEVYSAQCANRDDEDAALHRYLLHTTARARGLIEVALERVADAEGIEY